MSRMFPKQTFAEFLVARIEKYDAEILKEIVPQESWAGSVELGGFEPEPMWWRIRENVRKIAEGLHFKPSTPSGESIYPVFDAVFPDLNEAWKPKSVLDVILK